MTDRRRRAGTGELLEGPPGSPEELVQRAARAEGPEEVLEAVGEDENPRLRVPVRRSETGQVVEEVEVASPAAAEHWNEDLWRKR